jgi:hypothetical protein
VKKDASGAVFVSDVKMIAVDPNNTAEIESIMERAGRMRSVGATKMNETSSRSHAIFALHLKATNPQGTVLKGTLSLVDLAGSEKTKKSGTTGAALDESNAINQSLSYLSGVFREISSKSSHVNFRNCNLTKLLAPALSGDGKTLMVVNLSPTADSVPESLSSLRLAKLVYTICGIQDGRLGGDEEEEEEEYYEEGEAEASGSDDGIFGSYFQDEEEEAEEEESLPDPGEEQGGGDQQDEEAAGGEGDVNDLEGNAEEEEEDDEVYVDADASSLCE